MDISWIIFFFHLRFWQIQFFVKFQFDFDLFFMK